MLFSFVRWYYGKTCQDMGYHIFEMVTILKAEEDRWHKPTTIKRLQLQLFFTQFQILKCIILLFEMNRSYWKREGKNDGGCKWCSSWGFIKKVPRAFLIMLGSLQQKM